MSAKSGQLQLQIDRETPKGKTLHLIADNYATHKHPVVQEWLAKHLLIGPANSLMRRT